ncbi:MAG: PRTRC system ParB family protein [Betaproteobacteria bacterium]|nr:PRTRC system ParB family protein [Betaproteobacteria bacterium]
MSELKQPTLPVSKIVQGKNPRTYFDPVEMAELEEGIRAAGGVIQPILVRPIPGSDLYEIVAGERRWRAAKNVFGDSYEMPIVIQALSDTAAEALAVIENHHADMSAADSAQAAKRQMMRLDGDKEEVAKNLGWTLHKLDQRLALLTCTPAVLDALTQRKIKIGHAELLAGVPPEKQDRVLEAVLKNNVPVATLKGQLGQFSRRLDEAIFDTSVCIGCSHNSALQSGLFDESLGDGFCQHPTHYDELTLKAVEAKAESLRDEYPSVRIVKAGDGTTLLPLAVDGELGVGGEQHDKCKSCASFGCAISAMPGSYGDITPSLCFDAACHSKKVALWRKVNRDEKSAEKPPVTTQASVSNKKTSSPKPTNQTSQRIVEYRVRSWRRWLARALVTQPQRNLSVLIALAGTGLAKDVNPKEFSQVAHKIAGRELTRERMGLDAALREVDGLPTDQMNRLLLTITASAAFGVNESSLNLLLNYLEVDEKAHFKWDKEFLELHTINELDALARQTGLFTAMGVYYQSARAKKKPEFITKLLSVPGFHYEDIVPDVMRYPRKPVMGAAAESGGQNGMIDDVDAMHETDEEGEEETELAA